MKIHSHIDGWAALCRDAATLLRREQLPELFRQMGFRGHGVEVGTADGWYAAHLAEWNGTLHLVDRWRHEPGRAVPDACNYSDAVHRLNLDQTVIRFWHNPNVILHRGDSERVAAVFADGVLDWVYLDAGHDAESIQKDLDAWVRKVRPGGIVAGHDFLDGDIIGDDGALSRFDVARVVTAYFGKENLFVTEEQWPTWIYLKT